MNPTGGPRPLYVFGASGHGKVVAEAARRSGAYWIRGFLDDDRALWGGEWAGAPIVGGRDWLSSIEDGAPIALGVGDNRVRCLIALAVTANRHQLATVVHPSAVVAPSARVEAGAYLGPLAVVHADATLGRGCIVNSSAVVEHDCRLDDFVHVSPRAVLGGAVRVGEGVHVGLGAAVLPGVSLGPWAILGAGAVLIRSLSPGATAVGVPARVLAPHPISEAAR
jgi:sugar O-acyltransferase (sialic acid O-acetyltransferase NeuD family)